MTDPESPAQDQPKDDVTAAAAGSDAAETTPPPAAGEDAETVELRGDGSAEDTDDRATESATESQEAAQDASPQARGEDSPPHEAEAEGQTETAPEARDGATDSEGQGEEAPPPPPPREDPRLRALQAEVARKDELLREYIRAHKKAQAEWDAYRARLKRDEEAHVQAARGKAVEVLLDVGDDMERSLGAARQGGTVESLLEGMELVHRRFFRALEELGLEKHDPTGEPFDPETMEAIGVVPVSDAAQDGKVVHTLRVGYRLGDRELRPAVVQVGRKA